MRFLYDSLPFCLFYDFYVVSSLAMIINLIDVSRCEEPWQWYG